MLERRIRSESSVITAMSIRPLANHDRGVAAAREPFAGPADERGP